MLVEGAGAAARVLMGRRRADQIFLPNKWVFPGGRVDGGDREPRSGEPVTGLPEWLYPFARAAVRELAEETGIAWPGASKQSELHPLARAITPPGRVRRYDTWFFAAAFDAAAGDTFCGDGELLDLGWFTFADARRLDAPHITRLVLEDAATAVSANIGLRRPAVPFYFQGARGFECASLDCRAFSAPP
ncbi:MAG: NUDIX domain-containing protein [Hyphomicrobium sp.]